MKRSTIAVISACLLVAVVFTTAFAREHDRRRHNPHQRNHHGAVVGEWAYSTQGYSDEFVFESNGEVYGLNDPGNLGTWRVSNRVLELRWPNGWIHRYRLPEESGQLIGKAYGPGGERASAVLTR